jgi:hypothetical protein
MNQSKSAQFPPSSKYFDQFNLHLLGKHNNFHLTFQHFNAKNKYSPNIIYIKFHGKNTSKSFLAIFGSRIICTFPVPFFREFFYASPASRQPIPPFILCRTNAPFSSFLLAMDTPKVYLEGGRGGLAA